MTTTQRDHDRPSLTAGTLVAAALGVCVAQVGLAIPAVLNGLFQQDLHTTSSQLTWISDAFLVPITLLELTFGVLGDLFGRKRLAIIGGTLLGAGELFAALTHGVYYLWAGQGSGPAASPSGPAPWPPAPSCPRCSAASPARSTEERMRVPDGAGRSWPSSCSPG